MEYKGIVAGGSAKASSLGFPTANIPLTGDASGTYAAKVALEGSEHTAVAYADQSRGILEAHLFDFSGDLYGKEIAITLMEKLREAQTFTNEEELATAIAADAAAAREYHETT